MRISRLQFSTRLVPAVLSLAFIGIVQGGSLIGEGSRLYAPCGVCHSPKARGSSDGAIPSLAGQQSRYLEKQLALFRSGVRMDPAMQVVTAHPTVGTRHDAAVLANYLAGLDVNPEPVNGPGLHLRVGQELYEHICAACHGADGRGESGNRVPRIAGQHYPYLRRQIDVAADLHRDLAPPEMTSALRGMRPLEKEAVADYISRLGNADVLLDSTRSPP